MALYQGSSLIASASGSVSKPKITTVTLTAAGWDSSAKTQTVSASGVLSDETAQLI